MSATLNHDRSRTISSVFIALPVALYTTYVLDIPCFQGHVCVSACVCVLRWLGKCRVIYVITNSINIGEDISGELRINDCLLSDGHLAVVFCIRSDCSSYSVCSHNAILSAKNGDTNSYLYGRACCLFSYALFAFVNMEV